MANPQIENGHVDIANELVEALARIRISGEEGQVFWALIRKTYGWHKKEDRISLSQFCQMTGLKKQTVHRAINKLSSKKMIVIKKDDGQIRIYSINKNFENWEPSSKKSTVTKPSSILIKGVIKNDDKPSSKMMTTKEKKETITKEINTLEQRKNNLRERFEMFWNAFPKKRSKGQAEKAWNRIAPDEQLLETMISTIERAKKSEDWKKENGKFIPYPATWLNAKGWEDEIRDPVPKIPASVKGPQIWIAKEEENARRRKEEIRFIDGKIGDGL